MHAGWVDGQADPDRDETTASDVVWFLGLVDRLGMDCWIEGGWGVDALLTRQTRRHSDLDIVVRSGQSPRLEDLLHANGFETVATPDQRPWNFVLGDKEGRRIDFHLVSIDPVGNGVYGDSGIETFPAGSLDGTGRIQARSVRCLSAERQLAFLTNHDPRPSDVHDLAALRAVFAQCERQR